MNEIKCPYCGAEQNINHDDGYGYEENEIHNQQCGDCEKYFAYTTSISYYYDVTRADCLNDGNHNFKATRTYPVEFTRMECIDCGEVRRPTDEEMSNIINERG